MDEKFLASSRQLLPWALCVAPMMDWTDRHCRFFHRLLSPHARLYSEMVTAAAIAHGDRRRLLDFSAAEHPLALQLGGSDPQQLALATRIGIDWGYDEINLNVGCPSDRVQSGRFGACLMLEPQLVADCVTAMREEAGQRAPVTVKCRVGVDERDSEQHLLNFVDTVQTSGCSQFIVHARKAWLKGLSPKQNREVPPLQHERVHRLKERFPDLQIIINGGIGSDAQVAGHLRHVDGVMLGRMAYHEPYRLAELDHLLYGTPLPERDAVVGQMQPYIEQHLMAGGRLQHVTRHMLGLFQGLPGARAWRRHISENAHRPDADFQVLEDALAAARQQRVQQVA